MPLPIRRAVHGRSPHAHYVVGGEVDAKCLQYLCMKFKKIAEASNKGDIRLVKSQEYGGGDDDVTNLKACINGRNLAKTTKYRDDLGYKKGDDATTDHKIDLDLGGADAASNYAVITDACNNVAAEMKSQAKRKVLSQDGKTVDANKTDKDTGLPQCVGTVLRVTLSDALKEACK
jgi:hypothetical protein